MAQTIAEAPFSELIVYEVMINDTVSNLKSQSTLDNSLKMFSQKTFMNESSIKNLIDQLTAHNNFKDVIILNSKNKRIENKNEFESCYLSADTIISEVPKTNKIDTVMIKINYLNYDNLFKIKFFEKWSFDNQKLLFKKEIIAYSILLHKLKNGEEWVTQLLFTVISDMNALEYLISKNQLKQN
jgi:hypothetical protein